MELKYFFLIVIFFINQFTVFSQKKVQISGEETVFLNPDQTINEIKKKAIELAIYSALENKFGRIIYQNNQSFIESTESETRTKFLSKGNSLVKGKWLRTLEENCIQDFDPSFNQMYITCKVKGIAIELEEVKPEFIALPLECPKMECEETQFKNEQDFFLYFKSPKNGFLSVFLTDDSKSYKLYPIPGERETLFGVTANKEYYLFEGDESSDFDGYYLFTNNEFEMNTLYFIFSKSDYSLPILTKDLSNESIEIPENLGLSDFHEWVNNLRLIKEDVQVKEIPVTIINN
jgi:hypothetical protein